MNRLTALLMVISAGSLTAQSTFAPKPPARTSSKEAIKKATEAVKKSPVKASAQGSESKKDTPPANPVPKQDPGALAKKIAEKSAARPKPTHNAFVPKQAPAEKPAAPPPSNAKKAADQVAKKGKETAQGLKKAFSGKK